MIFKNKKQRTFSPSFPWNRTVPSYSACVCVHVACCCKCLCMCVIHPLGGRGPGGGGSLLPGLWERAQLASSSLFLLSSFSHAFTLIPSCQPPAQPRSCGDAVCSWGWRGRQKNPTPTSIHRHMFHGHQIMRGWEKNECICFFVLSAVFCLAALVRECWHGVCSFERTFWKRKKKHKRFWVVHEIWLMF